MICLGLGSNLGKREQNIFTAVKLLVEHPAIVFVQGASLYLTEPVGNTQQPFFLNTVVEIDTSLSPEELLTFSLDVENRMGRIRQERWGPRIIDIDLLCYHDRISHTEQLILPHPRLQERRFVLIPLCEIAPEMKMDRGTTVRQLLENCADHADVALYRKVQWPLEVERV